MNFFIPKHWRVFVLDDSQDRISWFRKHIPGVRYATTAEAALEILSTEKFDCVFLDHDLHWMDAGFPERLHGNGKEVARFLARTGFGGRVVIRGIESVDSRLPVVVLLEQGVHGSLRHVILGCAIGCYFSLLTGLE